MNKCSVCGVTERTNILVTMRGSNTLYCEKHRRQYKRYNRITDKSKPEPTKLMYCEVCGVSSLKTKILKNTKMNKNLCRRHFIQFNRHGKILEKTIYDKNDFIDKGTYVEIITRDTKGNKTGVTLVDKEDYEKIKNKKIYISKQYARISLKDGKKKNLHNFLMGCEDGLLVDHINSNFHNNTIGTLDNRRCNLRVANTQKNAFNINKGLYKGVRYKKSVNKYYSAIMMNGYNIWLGIYNTKNEALIARFFADILLFGDFRYKQSDNIKISAYNTLNQEQISNILNNVSKFINKKNLSFDLKEIDKQIRKE